MPDDDVQWCDDELKAFVQDCTLLIMSAIRLMCVHVRNFLASNFFYQFLNDYSREVIVDWSIT